MSNVALEALDLLLKVYKGRKMISVKDIEEFRDMMEAVYEAVNQDNDYTLRAQPIEGGWL